VPATTPSDRDGGPDVPVTPVGTVVDRDDIYKVYFHGPAYQVLERSWRQDDTQVGLMSQDLPANHHPTDLPLTGAPRLLELCFQTAGVWELGTHGRLALPFHVTSITAPGSEAALSGRAYAVVRPSAGGESFDAEVVDDAGFIHLRMAGYQTVVLPVPVDADLLRPLQIAVR
jgi:Polyketide synthase dehydratase N-terminal domain